MSKDGKTVLLEIITPREMFFSGQVEMLAVTTDDGQEGFLSGHLWCVKLLAEKGLLKIREPGRKELRYVRTKSGYVDIKDRFVVYTEEAEWLENSETAEQPGRKE